MARNLHIGKHQLSLTFQIARIYVLVQYALYLLLIMANFFGHALAGAFFIIIASWWCVQIYRRFYQSLQTPRGSDAFTSSVTWPVRTRKGWLDVEAYAAVVGAGLLILIELLFPTLTNAHLDILHTQHATIVITYRSN